MLNLAGYHATSQRAAASIMASRKFRCSRGDEHWLGDGVYFFEADIAPARWWATDVKSAAEWAILKARVSCPEDALLNLAIDEHRQYIEHVLHKIQERMQQTVADIAKYRDAEAINLFCSQISPHFKVIRGVFTRQTSYTKTRMSRLRNVHVQLAVREPEGPHQTYIFDMETVETGSTQQGG